MTKTEIICDQCGIRKGETNHWWIGGTTNVGFHLYPASYDEANSDYDLGTKQDWCSENCVSKALSEFMEKIRTTSVIEEIVDEFKAHLDKEVDNDIPF